jgi:hypothetical protein
MIESIFFRSLKGKRFRSRRGIIFEVVDIDPVGAGIVTLLLKDVASGAFYNYDYDGKVYRTCDCTDDIVEEV